MKNIKRQLLLTIILSLLSDVTFAYTGDLYLQAFNFNDSEVVPFQSVEKDWASNYRSGTHALSYQWYETGIRYKHWGFGLFQKNHTYLQFNSQTALIVHTIASKQPIDNQSYTVDLKVKHFNSYGLRLFNTAIAKPHFQWLLGVSLIYGQDLVDGTLKGSVTALTNKDYQFNNIQLNYFYSKDKLFDQQAARPRGEGYSIDSEIYWQPDRRIKLQFISRDLLGRIYWKNAPTTVAVIESDNKTYDANGYVKVNATLQGNQSTRNFTQHLAPYFAAKGSYNLYKDMDFLLEVDRFSIKTYQQIGISKTLMFQTTGNLLYEFVTHSVGINLKHKNIELQLMSDKLQPAKAHVFAALLNISYQY